MSKFLTLIIALFAAVIIAVSPAMAYQNAIGIGPSYQSDSGFSTSAFLMKDIGKAFWGLKTLMFTHGEFTTHDLKSVAINFGLGGALSDRFFAGLVMGPDADWAKTGPDSTQAISYLLGAAQFWAAWDINNIKKGPIDVGRIGLWGALRFSGALDNSNPLIKRGWKVSFGIYGRW